ncbi:Helicase associated domain-containing protein [Streptomyces sp. DvalAA-14]|uniref:DEAD/DEAH box helicase n=1 Tax=unclassified Streptomyces TaxID=2593676 RepID=UPI00081B166F|nr:MULTISPECIES: DEAD/DEAH box helicase [unclassified Streptomyces]MYS19235.1 DEAD/DEAH box helicase family protein [Streptomyces sp. SID4948]SCD39882.1 Helicase associated domain-containing protein [Streptomyces sp. DvalAA-14]
MVAVPEKEDDLTALDPLPHQVEASDAAVRKLELLPGQEMPARGLRTQVIAATGSGKTFMAVLTARKLRAGKVLVLVPTLDLLTQTVAAWRLGGRTGPVYGICSLRADEADFACTTDVDELVAWTNGLEQVTVFTTYASVGLGTLQRAHEAGLSRWSLVVVDEAHRTSGRGAKPWAAIHDNTKVPADRRLYMTATPRVWAAPEEEEGARAAPVLVASMEDDPDGLFGEVSYKLTLSQARDRGLVAAYQVVCVDVTDPELQAAALLGMEARSDSVRGSRLAALQTAAVKTSAERGLRRMLTFHYRTSEAEAMAAGVPAVSRRLHEDDPETYPDPARVWADWLCGEHRPQHRAGTLATFADPVGGREDGDLVPMRLRLLSSVRVLGEGVDTKGCDSVFFGDVRGSAVDILQIVGRALRMKPGGQKTASLVVPVFLAPGEDPDAMLTSRGYNGLAKVLAALRSHDSDTIEQLAEQQATSRARKRSALTTGSGNGQEGTSVPAQSLLQFSTPRDPAVLAQFMNLRILRPENTYWRHGIQAATRYVKENEDLKVPYAFVTPEDWDPADFPLGTWIADQRRFYNAGEMKPARVKELEDLQMLWSHWDVAFQEGLSAAREWAAEHGHFLPPTTAVWNGHPVGVWAKNLRTAGRRTVEIEARREAGLPVGSTAGTLTEERRDELEAIDPSWCPAWPVAWQRAYVLCRQLIEAGAPLPAPGEATVQGEDLGAWVQAQRLGWDQLAPAQQWMLENMLDIGPADPSERPQAPRTQADKWAANIRAARQFHAREGSLHVPRKAVERLTEPDGSVTEVKLGTFVDNARRRADKLSDERHQELTELDMRWT